jgi:hypothetical protein
MCTTAVAVALLTFAAAFCAPAHAQSVQLPVTPQPLPPAPPAPTYDLGLPPVQHPTGGRFPFVAGLKPYTPETNNMSLAGYLRQLVFWQTGKWISPADAERVVQQQKSY